MGSNPSLVLMASFSFKFYFMLLFSSYWRRIVIVVVAYHLPVQCILSYRLNLDYVACSQAAFDSVRLYVDNIFVVIALEGIGSSCVHLESALLWSHDRSWRWRISLSLLLITISSQQPTVLK